MIVLRRNTERRHVRSAKSEMWITFYPRQPACQFDEGFGAISILNEIKLPSETGIVSNLKNEFELITYVHKGALKLEGSTGNSGELTTEEFQCMVIGRNMSQRLTNTSRTNLAHFFRIYLRLPPSQIGDDCVDAQTQFTAAQRQNILCIVASPDARNASLRIHTDIHIYSSILDPGQHIVHKLLHGRKAWLHIIYGKIQANAIELTTGDGIGITNEHSISITVRENTELLLFDTASVTGKIHP